MSIIKNYVLLLKAQKNEETQDEYEVMLKENGFKVEQVKTLDFNYVNLEKLKEKLLKPHDYSGIVFSSPRCVNAVKIALINETLLNDWNIKDNYVVGEATYKAALEELNLNCLGKDTGNANVLSQIMLKECDKYTKTFLYPHGNLKMDILKTKFEGSNLGLDEILVYETISNENIKNEFANVTDRFSSLPEYIVFFSPSGITAVEDIIKMIPIELIKVIAIGPTTEMALLKAGIDVHKTAGKPTAQEILNIVINDKQNN